MSNRKYAAAVLEDGPASIDDKMQSTCSILADLMNQVAEDMLDKYINNNVPTATMAAILEVTQKEFEEIAPDLAKRYELDVSTFEDFTKPGSPHRIVIKPRPKPRWMWEPMSAYVGSIDASHITAGSINASTIQAGSITADRIDGYIRGNDTVRLDGMRDVRSIRVTERYGMGVINTGGMATINTVRNNINFAPIWHQGNDGAGTGLDVDMVDGIHTREWATAQLEPFDVQIGDTIYRNVEVTGVIEDV
jgi:hypothetical protein